VPIRVRASHGCMCIEIEVSLAVRHTFSTLRPREGVEN
jgi:hypothetical protein